MRSGAFLLAMLASACGAPPTIPFVDAAARSCNYDSAQHRVPRATCDIEAGMFVTCAAPAVPGYVLYQDESPGAVLSNCPACVSETSYDFHPSTCAAVTCTSAADCPLGAICTAGTCLRPG